MRENLRDERRDIVLDLYLEKKLSAIAIEKQMGISRGAIYRVLHKAGISPSALHESGERKGKQGGNKQSWAVMEPQIIADYLGGMGYIPLAAKYKIAPKTIRRMLQRHGHVSRKRGNQGKHVAQELGEQMMADWKNGMSQNAMALKYRMHQTTIGNILRRWDIHPDMRRSRGATHGRWKSGRIIAGGYIHVRLPQTHPWYTKMANINGYVAEHRLVMAESLGRSLEDHETVHHKNGQKMDNLLDNLQLRQGNHGKGVIYHCADCGSFNVVAQAIADPADDRKCAYLVESPPLDEPLPRFDLKQLAFELA
jgi:Mor family transcriptional regulator